jgi:hypothetical protein
MSEDTKSEYDLEFITQALGLIPINGGDAAISPGAITDIAREDNGDWMVTLGSASIYTLTPEDMAEFEQTIKQRAEAQKLIQREAIRAQMLAQAEVMGELQNGVQTGGVIVNAVPTGRRFRQ